jgi:hypothetical protein
VFCSDVRKGGVGEKISKILQPDEAPVFRVEQAVVQRRKIDRHRQRDDHPDEQQCDGRRQQSPSENLCLLRRHRRLLLSLEGKSMAAVRSVHRPDGSQFAAREEIAAGIDAAT